VGKSTFSENRLHEIKIESDLENKQIEEPSSPIKTSDSLQDQDERWINEGGHLLP